MVKRCRLTALGMAAAHAAWLAAFPVAAHAQHLLQPPHDMRWGDSPQKMMDWASEHAMDVQIRIPGNRPGLRIIRIEPGSGFIPDTEIRSAEGRFLHGRMFEFTTHYEDPEASFELMKGRFETHRRALAREHGPFLANRVLREAEGGFVIRTRSFHREPVKGLFVLLTLTTIENQAQGGGIARFSVVYRNENLKAELKGGP